MKLPSCFKHVFLLTLGVYGLLSSSFVLPSMLMGLNFPHWQVGMVMSSFYFGATLARPLGGYFSEKFGARRTILFSAAAGALVALSFVLLNFKVLLVSRFMVGGLYSIIYVTLTAYQGATVPAQCRGRVFSFLGLASISPQFLVVPLSEFFIDRGDVKIYMIFSSVILALLALFVLSMPGERQNRGDGEEVRWGSWSELLERRDTWALLASVFVLSFTATASTQYVPSLVRSFNLKGTLFTWSFTSVIIAIRLTFCGKALSLFNRRASLCFLGFAEALSVALAARACGAGGFAAAAILFGLSHGVAFPAISALLPDVMPRHLLPKGAALFLIFNDLPPILLPLIFGAVPESVGLAGVLAAVGTLGLLLWPLNYSLLWRRPALRLQGGGEKHDSRAF